MNGINRGCSGSGALLDTGGDANGIFSTSEIANAISHRPKCVERNDSRGVRLVRYSVDEAGTVWQRKSRNWGNNVNIADKVMNKIAVVHDHNDRVASTPGGVSLGSGLRL